MNLYLINCEGLPHMYQALWSLKTFKGPMPSRWHSKINHTHKSGIGTIHQWTIYATKTRTVMKYRGTVK